jgi:hypothetical protein
MKTLLFRKTILAGLSGGIAMNMAMLLTFRLIGFGWDGGGFLLNPSVQSAKLIRVWTELKPLPLVVNNPAPIMLGLIIFGIVHAYIYQWISTAWPVGIAKRGLRLAAILFLLCFLFWEFFTPFNLFGEPLILIGAELVFWAFIAIAESFAIVAVYEHKSRSNIRKE